MTKKQFKSISKLALAKFEAPLGKYGFSLESMRTEDHFSDMFFGFGTRYIRITADRHPRNPPPHINVILGDGGRDFLETDWNSVPLWRLKNFLLQSDVATEYVIESPKSIPTLIELAFKELLQFGGGFLNGNFESFLQVRSKQNQARTPYQIRSPDKDGNYTVARDEPLSAKMKKKYS